MRDSLSVLLEPAQDIRSRFDSARNGLAGQASPSCWETIWHIASRNHAGILQDLTRLINNLVFPVLEYTRDQSQQLQQLNPFENPEHEAADGTRGSSARK